MSVFLAGFAREVITPPVGAPLAGYFTPRPNKGALDDLHVRVLLFSDGRTICGVVSLDVCLISGVLLQRIHAALEGQGAAFRHKLIIAATHTHTAPYTADLFGVKADEDFMERVAACCGAAVKRAWADLAPAELYAGHADDNPLAFCRRYHMKTGKVVTNPGKLNKLLGFAEHEAGKTRWFETTCLKFGREVAIVSLPGEPFAEIGMRIRERSPFSETIVPSLSQGSCGYVPLKECFPRGGYETLPVRGGGADPDTAQLLIETAVWLL